jgi:hypothetical protein
MLDRVAFSLVLFVYVCCFFTRSLKADDVVDAPSPRSAQGDEGGTQAGGRGVEVPPVATSSASLFVWSSSSPSFYRNVSTPIAAGAEPFTATSLNPFAALSSDAAAVAVVASGSALAVDASQNATSATPTIARTPVLVCGVATTAMEYRALEFARTYFSSEWPLLSVGPVRLLSQGTDVTQSDLLRSYFSADGDACVGLIGPSNDEKAISLSAIVQAPVWVDYGSGAAALSDKVLYPGYSRVIESVTAQAQRVVRLVMHFNFWKVSLLSTDNRAFADTVRAAFLTTVPYASIEMDVRLSSQATMAECREAYTRLLNGTTRVVLMAIDQRTTDPEVFSRLTAVAAEIQAEWEAAQHSPSPTPHRASETTPAALVSTSESSSAAQAHSGVNHGESNQSSVAAHDGTAAATLLGVTTRPGEQQLGTAPLGGLKPFDLIVMWFSGNCAVSPLVRLNGSFCVGQDRNFSLVDQFIADLRAANLS